MKTTTESKHTPTPWHIDKGMKPMVVGANKSYVALNVSEGDAALIVRAVNNHQALLDFAMQHHDLCEDCEGSGKVYNNADPTSGQWVECRYLTAINKAMGN